MTVYYWINTSTKELTAACDDCAAEMGIAEYCARLAVAPHADCELCEIEPADYHDACCFQDGYL